MHRWVKIANDPEGACWEAKPGFQDRAAGEEGVGDGRRRRDAGLGEVCGVESGGGAARGDAESRATEGPVPPDT